VSFLPVLAYDGANMTQIDAGGILDIAMAGTSATLLARKWESALLVNVDNDTLRRIINDPEALAAVERIEGWRSLGDNPTETIINKSGKVKKLKVKGKDRDLTPQEKKELSDEEKEYKSKPPCVQHRADEPCRVRLPPLRRFLAPPSGNRASRWPYALQGARPVRVSERSAGPGSLSRTRIREGAKRIHIKVECVSTLEELERDRMPTAGESAPR
jgi:hypothetical protein